MLLSLAAGLPLLASPQEAEVDRLTVATTLPYIADIAARVGGDQVTAFSLVPAGVDPHFVEDDLWHAIARVNQFEYALRV